MLEEFLMPVLEEEGPDDMLFQQDQASSYFHKEDFLNRKFPEKWTGRGKPVTWPPCLPDHTPIFFRGTSKMLFMCDHWQPLCQYLLVG
jgi:hypothetical protein